MSMTVENPRKAGARALDPPYLDAFLVDKLISAKRCKDILKVAHNLEKVPDWDEDEEKLDGGKLWQKHIFALDAEYRNTVVDLEPLSSLIVHPMDSRIKMFIRQCFSSVKSDLTLTYAFLRKYSPDTRPGLRLHRDCAEFTVSIQLNSPRFYEGGALELHSRQPSVELADLEPEEGFMDDALAREKERRLRYPPLRLRIAEGNAIIHRGFLYHRIAPVTRGSRYSILMFYDYPSEL